MNINTIKYIAINNIDIHGNLKVTILQFCKIHSDGLRIGSQTASYLRKRNHIKRGFCQIRFKKSNMFSKERCYRKLINLSFLIETTKYKT